MHAPRAELLLEAERDLERAAVDADVLAEHEDALVAAHLRCAAPSEIGLRGRCSSAIYLPVGDGVSRALRGDGVEAACPRAAWRDRQRRLLGALERVVESPLDLGRRSRPPPRRTMSDVLRSHGAEALERVALRPLLEQRPSGRRTRRRARRAPPSGGSRTRSASGRRRARAFSIARFASR